MSTEKTDQMRDDTMLAHHGEQRSDYHGAIVPPIFQNSLFAFDSWEDIDAAFDDRVNNPIYSRGCNPTVVIAEEKIAKMARAEKAKLFGSGMAAITAAVLHVVKSGDHVVAVNNMYGPARNLLSVYLANKMGIDVTFVDGSEVSDFENAIRPNTRLIYLESPSTAVFRLQNIADVASLARSRGIVTIIDNSWASPVFQKPISLGVDLEVHSVSKYIGGHSDLVGGVVIGAAERLGNISIREFELFGAIMSPFNAWLVTRSLRTLPMRMQRHNDNGLTVAKFLEQDARVAKVAHPGLASHPEYELGKKQMTGYGGLFGFTLATDELPAIKRFFNAVKIFQRGVSWGGHESLLYAPAISYLKEFSPEDFADLGISVGNMRVSIGLENPDDLIADLGQALNSIG